MLGEGLEACWVRVGGMLRESQGACWERAGDMLGESQGGCWERAGGMVGEGDAESSLESPQDFPFILACQRSSVERFLRQG